MGRLILVAAGGLARETISAVEAGGEHEVIGLLDDDRRRRGEHVHGYPVLGGLDAAADYPDAQFVLCAGRGRARQAIAQRLGLPDERYATVIDPLVRVGSGCQVDRGSVILAGSVLTVDVHVGRHVVIMPNVTLTHDVVAADYVTLCSAVALAGAVHVGEGAYLGQAASVRQDCRVGADATIGMGAVVLRDVPPAQTWSGVPAAPMRQKLRQPVVHAQAGVTS